MPSTRAVWRITGTARTSCTRWSSGTRRSRPVPGMCGPAFICRCAGRPPRGPRERQGSHAGSAGSGGRPREGAGRTAADLRLTGRREGRQPHWPRVRPRVSRQGARHGWSVSSGGPIRTSPGSVPTPTTSTVRADQRGPVTATGSARPYGWNRACSAPRQHPPGRGWCPSRRPEGRAVRPLHRTTARKNSARPAVIPYAGQTDAGWSSSVARWAHNPEVAWFKSRPRYHDPAPGDILSPGAGAATDLCGVMSSRANDVSQTTIHCWFAPEAQVAWSRAAPLAVDAPATWRHLPLLTLVKVT